MHKDAVISECGLYRYTLVRVWDPTLRPVVWVMLNPSTADATEPDHTMTKCIGFSRSWNCGSIILANLFAYRSRDPKKLVEVADPVGPRNAYFLDRVLRLDTMKVVGWGANPAVANASSTVAQLKKHTGLQCLGYTQGGQPRHPLMLPYSTKLEPWP